MPVLPKLNIAVALQEVEISYVRSSGPGGQNVNKVNSKAVLRWDLFKSAIFDELKPLIASRLAHRLTNGGEIVLTSDRFRDQIRNREDCLEKLAELLQGACRQEKARKETKPSYSSRLRVKEGKRRDSSKKSLRKRPGNYD